MWDRRGTAVPTVWNLLLVCICTTKRVLHREERFRLVMRQTHPLGALLLAYWMWCKSAAGGLHARILDLRSPGVEPSCYRRIGCVYASKDLMCLCVFSYPALNIIAKYCEVWWCYDVCVRVLLQLKLCILGRLNHAMKINRAMDKYLTVSFSIYIRTSWRKSITWPSYTGWWILINLGHWYIVTSKL
jgi:hypothetical protein